MTLSDAIEKYHTSKGLKKWGLWIGIFLVIALTVAVFAYKRRAKMKEILALRNEIVSLTLDARAKERQISNEKNIEIIKDLAKEYNAIQHNIDNLDREIGVKSNALEEELATVRRLKSWADLNEYNKSRPS